MATVYSDVRTNTTQNDPSEFVKANQVGGSVRVARAVYEASNLASGDVIECFALPTGARVVGGYLYNDGLGVNTTVSVGHGAYTDADGTAVAAAGAFFKAGTSTASAGRNEIANTLGLGGNSEVSLEPTAGNEFVVTATMGGAAGTGTIEVVVFYVVA